MQDGIPEFLGMDLPLAGYAVYEMMQVTTGIPLYSTTATFEEILQANRNLQANGLGYRFFPKGTFVSPSLHGRPA